MGDEDTPAWAKDLLAQFGKMNMSINDIKKDLRDLVGRIGNAETRIQAVEDEQTTQKGGIQSCKKRLDKLESRISYQESQSRRNNLVLVGLKEGLLEEDAEEELAEILRYILDREGTEPTIEVERHHRTLRPRPVPDEPQRPYIIRLLKHTDRERIRKAAIAKGRRLAEEGEKLRWKGKPFRVYQDLPPEIQDARREYSDIKKKLYKARLRHGHLFPARLIVTINGDKHIYNTPNEALEDLRKRLPAVFG